MRAPQCREPLRLRGVGDRHDGDPSRAGRPDRAGRPATCRQLRFEYFAGVELLAPLDQDETLNITFIGLPAYEIALAAICPWMTQFVPSAEVSQKMVVPSCRMRSQAWFVGE